MPKYKLQEMPDIHNTGKRKVYPKMMVNRTLTQSDFIEKMQDYNRALSTSVIEAVVTDVKEMLVRMLSMGYNVKLDGLGTFALSLGFEDDKTTEITRNDDKMAYRKVGVKNVNFKPDAELVKDLKRETDKDLERAMSGVKMIKKIHSTREQRIAKALEVIEKKGFMALTDYAFVNNLSRTVASQDLKEICAEPTSPIMPIGNHSHKVWVRRTGNNNIY